MPSLSSQWDAAKAAWNDDESHLSPGTRFGLMFDPLAYIGDAAGVGDKYRNFINKTGDQSNLTLSKALGTDDRGGWAANKPASTIGLMAAAYYGGGAMMGGGGGGAGSSGGGNLGFFGNGGQGGMAGVGQGNAGQLFANTGINTGGVQGVGGTGAGGFMQQAGGMQGLMQMGQGLPGMQQQPQQEQQQQGPKPYWYRGQVIWM
jgi:hypothetical protein